MGEEAFKQQAVDNDKAHLQQHLARFILLHAIEKTVELDFLCKKYINFYLFMILNFVLVLN